MRQFVQPLFLRRVALVLLFCWLVPLLGTMGVSIFFAGRDNKTPVKTAVLPAEAAGETEAPGRIEAGEGKAEEAPAETSAGGDSGAWSPAAEEEAPRRAAWEEQNAPAENTSPAPTRVQSTPRPVPGYQNIDLTLLARIIHAEARGEPVEGQVAVGAVLLNRVKNSRFPNDLWSNIFKSGEFCTVRDGQIWLEPDAAAYRAARLALSGWDPTYGAIYFYNPTHTTSRWIWSRPVTTRIGRHVFAR